MPAIGRTITIQELAALVSQALEEAGITATLSGGAAVAVYSENEYQSFDLDFVTNARVQELIAAFAHWHDRQSLDQAASVARRQDVDWSELLSWAKREGIDSAVVHRLRERTEQG